MAENAPYYQIRGHFTNANAHLVPENVDQYEFSTSVTLHNTTCSDRQSCETPIASLENHNFVELLEAATTAATGQAQAMTDRTMNPGRSKRKRVSSSPVDELASQRRGGNISGPKRARTDAPTVPQHYDTEGML
jgi:hypothetical protein